METDFSSEMVSVKGYGSRNMDSTLGEVKTYECFFENRLGDRESMSDRIYINQGRVKEDAAQVKSAAAYLQKVSLSPQDTRTTLAANEKGKSAYESSQERISKIGLMLDKEAQNIRELGVAFTEFDEMMGSLGENGVRHSMIRAEK